MEVDLGPERVVVLLARVPTERNNEAAYALRDAVKDIAPDGSIFVSIGREDPQNNAAVVGPTIERMRNEIG